MELVVFDLDGTLLNRDSIISLYTSETLRLLSEREIAYTVATGRTLHSARGILEGHRFELPQAFKNGVMIWHPEQGCLLSSAVLTPVELYSVIHACITQRITPFIFTLDEGRVSTVYHPSLQSEVERDLILQWGKQEHVVARPLNDLPNGAIVTHVSAIGSSEAINSVFRSVKNQPHLVAYSGIAMEGSSWRWIDIHHTKASKGGAVQEMKEMLGLEHVICFGDSENDLSMFQAADESYAPANASDIVKSVATAVIGHHDEEGIARFLRKRFAIDA